MTVPGDGPGGSAVVAVGVDGSDVSLAALAWAAHDAMLRGARLRVVTAWNLLPPDGVGDLAAYAWTDGEVERACHAMLDEALAATPVTTSLRVERVVRSGRPAAVLEDAARDAAVLVVGARGRGGFSRLLLGSVSSHCAQHARGPVVVVRPPRPHVGVERPVLCGVDGSPDSRSALRLAADEAALRDLPLLVVHAVYWDLAGIDLIRPAPGELHQWGQRLVDRTVAEVLAPSGHLSVEARTVDGHPGEVLGDLSGDAELLVVGTRGHSAVGAALLGSVSGYCLRRADCPVAVVPAVAQPAGP